MVTQPPKSHREQDLETIRSTYDQYRRGARERLWDLRNEGFARLIADRDRAIVTNMRASLGMSAGRVLDLGFGNGRLAEAARSAQLPITQWVGVDLDGEAVRQAARAVPWASFVEGSADRLPFGDGSFDVALASALFSSLPSAELERAVAMEIDRVLVLGGWLVWYDLRFGNPFNRAVHGLSAKRLAALFPGWRAELRSMSLLPPLARRLGPITGVTYPVLEAVPLLRSHLSGRLQRPG